MQKIYPNAEAALEGLLFDGMFIAAGGQFAVAIRLAHLEASERVVHIQVTIRPNASC